MFSFVPGESVLDAGTGTGKNLTYIPGDVKITSVDINTDMLGLAKQRAKKRNLSVDWVVADLRELPFEDNSFDVVVHTLVFCSVPNVENGLREISRVLKSDGTIIFIEHVLPKHKRMKRLFKFINPIWKRIASGCNVTREYEKSLNYYQ